MPVARFSLARAPRICTILQDLAKSFQRKANNLIENIENHCQLRLAQRTYTATAAHTTNQDSHFELKHFVLSYKLRFKE